MRVLHSWLKKYLAFRIQPDVLAERLGMLGLEIENVEYLGERYKGFVVGEVLECVRHPKADRLTVCRVTTGKDVLQVVCGAPNVASGQKVALGLVGATVPQNQHAPTGKPFVLSRVSIRGVESEGMICSEYELGLGPDADGILVLENDSRVGQPLAKYLGLDDIAYDIEITANRPDWLSHFGVAREIGVLVGKSPRLPAVRLNESGESIRKHLSVRVDDRTNCLRFAARMIRGAKIKSSPAWLQNSLLGVGLRPRNNVVDITNYVMLECGQPLHAFDYQLLRNGTIVVRRTTAPSEFTTLDGKTHQLPGGAVMVCDAEREVSIAGIMGGANSEISENTVDLVLESANWRPASIRRTARALGITSDASQRFERGADPEMVRYALDRAAALTAELTGGALLKGCIDVYPRKFKPKPVPLRPERVNGMLGTSLSAAEITRMLRLLNITPSSRSKGRTVYNVPTYRVDVEREIDLIEEVARVYGYDNVEVKTTSIIDIAHPFHTENTSSEFRDYFARQGFREIISHSLQDESSALLGAENPVALLNPLSSDMNTLRSSLIPGMLRVVAHNVNHGNANLRLFEIGHVFHVDDSDRPKYVENFLEEERLGILLTGRATPVHWSDKGRPVDLFDLKGEIQTIAAYLGLDKCKFISYSTSVSLAEPSISIEINGTYAGWLGLVRENIARSLSIESDVYVAELNLSALGLRRGKRFESLPRFPKVNRDVAFVVGPEVQAEDVETFIKSCGSTILASVELFDKYEGDPLPQGRKSLAFSLGIMSREKTLTDAEIDSELRQIVEGVTKKFGASLRSVK